jgi:hypothetical protein
MRIKVYRKGTSGIFGGTQFTEFFDGWASADIHPKMLNYMKLAYGVTEQEPVVETVEKDAPKRRGRPPKSLYEAEQ